MAHGSSVNICEWVVEKQLNIQSSFLGMETVVLNDPYFCNGNSSPVSSQKDPDNQASTKKSPTPNLRICHNLEVCVLYELCKNRKQSLSLTDMECLCIHTYQAGLSPLETFHLEASPVSPVCACAGLQNKRRTGVSSPVLTHSETWLCHLSCESADSLTASVPLPKSSFIVFFTTKIKN